jgi:hypothetical protein
MQVLILHSGLLIENPDLALAPRNSHCSGTITDRMDASHAKWGLWPIDGTSQLAWTCIPVLFTVDETRYAD